MKYQVTEPIGRRSNEGTKHSVEAHRLPKLVEDPLPEKRDMSAEQKVAFRQPGQGDARVAASESDQSRTR